MSVLRRCACLLHCNRNYSSGYVAYLELLSLLWKTSSPNFSIAWQLHAVHPAGKGPPT